MIDAGSPRSNAGMLTRTTKRKRTLGRRYEHIAYRSYSIHVYRSHWKKSFLGEGNYNWVPDRQEINAH